MAGAGGAGQVLSGGRHHDPGDVDQDKRDDDDAADDEPQRVARSDALRARLDPRIAREPLVRS